MFHKIISARRFGISDESLLQFTTLVVNHLNKDLKTANEELHQAEKNLTHLDDLNLLNKDVSQLNPLKKNIEKKLEQYIHLKREEKIYELLLSQLNVFVDKNKKSKYEEFFIDQRMNKKKLSFNKEVETYIFFQNHIIEFLERIYAYSFFHSKEHIAGIREHYKNVCAKYLENKLLKTGSADTHTKKHTLNKTIEELYDYTSIQKEYPQILTVLESLFPEKKQAAKVYKFLLLIKSFSNHHLKELEEGIDAFASNDRSRFPRSRVKADSFGKLLEDKYKPYNNEIKIDPVQQNYIKENFSEGLKELLNKALADNSAKNYLAIHQYLNDSLKISNSEMQIILSVIKIITNNKLKKVAEKDFLLEEKQLNLLCKNANSILELNENLNKFLGSSFLVLNLQDCFKQITSENNDDQIVELCTYNSNDKLTAEVHTQGALFRASSSAYFNSKETALAEQEDRFFQILQSQLILAANVFLAKHKVSAAQEKEIFELVKENFKCENYEDVLFLLKETIGKDIKKSPFVVTLLKVLHAESFGIFYLMAKDYKKYVEFDAKVYLGRQLIESDLISSENFLDYLATAKVKISGEKAQQITKDTAVVACNDTLKIFDEIEKTLKGLQLQEIKEGLYKVPEKVALSNVHSEMKSAQNGYVNQYRPY